MPSARQSPSPSVLRVQDSAPEPSGPLRASRPVLERDTAPNEFAHATDAGLAIDLARIAIRIAKRQGISARSAASPSRMGWPGRSGRVHAINRTTGIITIAAGRDEFTIVDMLADRNLEVGDELAWDEANGVGMAVYENRTKGTRPKVFVEAHQTPASQLSLEQRGW